MECVPLEGKKVKALVSHIAWLIFGVHLSAMQHMTELGKYFRRTAESPKKSQDDWSGKLFKWSYDGDSQTDLPHLIFEISLIASCGYCTSFFPAAAEDRNSSVALISH